MGRLIVDIDGVVLNINKEVEKEVVKTYPNFRMSDVKSYNFRDRFITDDMRKIIFAEYHKESTFTNSELFDNSVEPLKEVMKFMDVVFYSQSYNWEVACAKQGILDKPFKGCDYTYIPFVGEEKPSIDGDYVFEDSLDNMVGYINNGTTCLLFDRTYNKHISHVGKNGAILSQCIRVGCMEEAVRFVLNDAVPNMQYIERRKA